MERRLCFKYQAASSCKKDTGTIFVCVAWPWSILKVASQSIIEVLSFKHSQLLCYSMSVRSLLGMQILSPHINGWGTPKSTWTAFVMVSCGSHVYYIISELLLSI